MSIESRIPETPSAAADTDHEHGIEQDHQRIEQRGEQIPSSELALAAQDQKFNSAESRKQFHIRKLQEPYINAFFRLMTREPHLADQLQMRYERRREFENFAHILDAPSDRNDQMKRDAIRRLAPFWSTVATHPEARAYFQIALDEASDASSSSIKEALAETEAPYVHELVIGAGIHGSIYNAEFTYHQADTPRLTIDGATRLGGQFRQVGGPAFFMNTPNRPINRDDPEKLDNPNVNSLGPHAPAQLTDLSGSLFADNETIGLAAAINQHVSADTMLGSIVTRVTANTDASKPGAYRVEMLDRETQETQTIYTDRVITSMGLGKANYGFKNMDATTERLCAPEDGRVMTYPEFLREVGDRTNPFPLERFAGKRVVIIGGGHSGLTVAEYLAGIGPEYRGSVASMGSPREITILGTQFEHEKAFRDVELARYGKLASVMQRHNKPEESKDGIVQPLANLRAISLEESSDSGDKKGPLMVCCEEKTATSDAPARKIEADIIISTVGFTNEYGRIFGDLVEKNSGRFDSHLEDFAPEGVDRPVARILKGHENIVFIGAGANMPASQRELTAASKFNRPTNPIAIPNTVDDTITVARAMLARDRAAQYEPSAENFRPLPIRPISIPDSVTEHEPTTYERIIDDNGMGQPRNFQPELRYDQLLELVALEHGQRFRTSRPSSITFRVSFEETGAIAIRSTSPLPLAQHQILEHFLDTRLVQETLHKLNRRRGKKQPLTLTITTDHERAPEGDRE